jgi:hypothetical protein
MREAWEATLKRGLQTGEIPTYLLTVLAQYMDPPELHPKFEIRINDRVRRYFCNDRQMHHLVLLGKRFAKVPFNNSFSWLRHYRIFMDAKLPLAEPRVQRRAIQILMEVEENYADPSSTGKPMFEAFCLGRVYELLGGNDAANAPHD